MRWRLVNQPKRWSRPARRKAASSNLETAAVGALGPRPAASGLDQSIVDVTLRGHGHGLHADVVAELGGAGVATGGDRDGHHELRHRAFTPTLEGRPERTGHRRQHHVVDRRTMGVGDLDDRRQFDPGHGQGSLGAGRSVERAALDAGGVRPTELADRLSDGSHGRRHPAQRPEAVFRDVDQQRPRSGWRHGPRVDWPVGRGPLGLARADGAARGRTSLSSVTAAGCRGVSGRGARAWSTALRGRRRAHVSCRRGR